MIILNLNKGISPNLHNFFSCLSWNYSVSLRILMDLSAFSSSTVNDSYYGSIDTAVNYYPIFLTLFLTVSVLWVINLIPIWTAKYPLFLLSTILSLSLAIIMRDLWRYQLSFWKSEFHFLLKYHVARDLSKQKSFQFHAFPSLRTFCNRIYFYRVTAHIYHAIFFRL